MSQTGPWPPVTPTEAQQRSAGELRARIYRETHTITDVTKMPLDAKLFVLVNDSYSTHDGYSEREGGGYHTVSTVNFVVFDSEEALQHWILENHQKKTFRVFTMRAVKVELKTVLDLGDV